jgi:hypothetical protein
MSQLNKTIPVLLLAVASLAGPRLSAQSFGMFGNALTQGDTTKRTQYQTNLSHLQNAWNLNTFNFGSVLNGLSNNTPNPNTIGNIDTLLPGQQFVIDSISSFLSGMGFGGADSLSVISQIDTTYSIWNTNSGDINTTYNQNQGQLGPVNALPTNMNGVGTTWYSSYDSLSNNQNSAFATIPAAGPGNFAALLDELFSPSLFTKFELTAGNQTAKVNYYYTFQQTQAPVIGVRSVEQFDRLWEPRWRAQGSWFKNNTNNINPEIPAQQNEGINPLMFNANFDVMFNPSITIRGVNTPVRLITLLGVEAASYVPAHRNPAYPTSMNNKGYTTGWGPVIGGGLSTTVGQTVIYALGTTSYGDVVDRAGDPLKYRYRSSRMEAGVRYGNTITLRYEIGLSANWADDGNKSVRYQQLTLGLPLDTFFR